MSGLYESPICYVFTSYYLPALTVLTFESMTIVLYLLEFIISAGFCKLWFTGVVLYASRASSTSCPAAIVFSILALTLLTKCSAITLDCGYRGLDILWSICHEVVKSLCRLWELNCGQPSVISVSGIPYSPNVEVDFLLRLRILIDFLSLT